MDSIRCKIIKSEYKVQWKLHNGKFYDSLKTLLTESDKTFSDNSYIAVVFHKDSVEVAKMRYKMEFNIDYDTIELKGYLDGFSGNPYDVLIKFNNQHLGLAIEQGCVVSYYFNLKIDGCYSSDSESESEYDDFD